MFKLSKSKVWVGFVALALVSVLLLVASCTGPTGVTGPTGPVGPAGPTGPVGPTGSASSEATCTPTCTTTPVCTTCPAGPTGATGAAGATGATGPIGLTGATGVAGATGATGPIGLTGATGAAGATGATGPIGLTGATGATGAVGPVGPSGNLGYSDFYALMPGDNFATVAVGAAVEFPQNGPTTSPAYIIRQAGVTSVYSFVLPDIGTYEVTFQVSVSEPGQLVLYLDPATGTPAPLAYSVVGRASGTSQIVGICLVTTTVPNSVLSVRNPAGNSTALTITPTAGGASSVSAHLVIMRIY